MKPRHIVPTITLMALAGFSLTACQGVGPATTSGTFPYCSTTHSGLTGSVVVSRSSHFPCVIDHRNDYQAPVVVHHVHHTTVIHHTTVTHHVVVPAPRSTPKRTVVRIPSRPTRVTIRKK